MTLHEADTILFSALSEVGFHSDEAASISDLNTEQIYEATVLCLKAIAPQKLANISAKLSNSLMTRFAHCSELAAMCKELGLKGDIDYHTFLYGSVKEVRAVLSFLVEKLPKKSTPKTITRRDRFLCEFGSMLKQQLSAQSSSDHHQEHVPFMTEPISLNKDRHPSIQLSSPATRAPSIQLISPATLAPSILDSVAVSQQSDASQQNQYQQLEPSSTGVLRVSAADLAHSLKISRPERSAKSISAPAQSISASDDTDVSQSKTSELSPLTTKPDDPSSSGEADQLQKMLEEARDRLSRSRRRFQRGQDRLQQLRISTEKMALETSHLTNQLNEQRTELQHLTAAHQLLHHPEQAEQLLARAKQRQSRHRQQWEERRKQLVQQLSQMKPTLEQLRSERGQLQQRMGNKQIQIDQLKPTAQQLSRTFYLRRIAEVSVTSRQQRATLLASVDQLHVLRQQINADSERLERAFTAAEQLIFKDAVESTWSAAVYRSLASLHDTSVQLVETAERTGTVSRHVQRLQNQIDLEKASGIEESFARLSRDLQAIVDQNSELQRQLNVV